MKFSWNKLLQLPECLGIFKKNPLIFWVGIIGLAFLLLGSCSSGDGAAETPDSPQYYGEKIEAEKLEKLLLQIPEVQKVCVMITYEDAGRLEYAYDYTGDLSRRKEGDIQENVERQMVKTRQNGDELPVTIRQVAPKIKGISIVAQGEVGEAEYKIFRAVQTVTGAEAHRIEVIYN